MLDPAQFTGKQRQFVQQLQQVQRVDSLRSHCTQHGFDFNFIKGFLLSGALAGAVEWQEQTHETWGLTAKGQGLQEGIPGAALAAQLLQGVTDVSTLLTVLGEAFSLHYGALRKGHIVDLRHDQGPIGDPGNTIKTIALVQPDALVPYPQYQATYEALKSGQVPGPDAAEALDWLQQQGYVARQGQSDYRLTVLEPLRDLNLQPVVTALTSDLILSGQWQNIVLKAYDIQAPVPDVPYGRPTLLTQCIERIRDIFLNMGFDEMAGCIVESAFWNFDALFTPQDHPAREVQDTFYLANPQTVPLPEDRDLVEQVRQVHEANYGGQWTEAEASRAILRAHTTTSTARRLHQIQGRDGKYFSIDKVFRNETVDRTHLAEFHQIEGVVVGELLSVRTLMGYLIYFYERLGFKNLKLKPTYNPYTEPSLEVYAYHPPSQQYLEVGNSGLFRQEMLTPLGCGDKSTVAWGLGLERIAMLLYDVEKLSDLVGPDIRLPSSLSPSA
ncbi:phenylalanine--tRNA ligase subunit alpha [Leptolyngbya sp. PCC 6406]|uniref:phenylalanine--tRNA ligase subunit alpha n=1 Tax=Leptolyngbya sp. PCC 6406 TaxID=1173264 RepID=UPI0002DC5BCB|nr:phenylalanine--tRNA ligase subunit alpha [Leptolyngbya sp. PCC 6406]